ncbi:MAG TPA: hypothetical protein VK473_16320 [Terriglobales bacterium]|nr:hypothetical protein [Terriglobales bacterium]
MKPNLRVLLSLVVCTLIFNARLARAGEGDSLNLNSGNLLFEYVGQVVNGNPTAVSSKQYGNLQGVTGVDPSTPLTFYTEATTTKTVSNGPLRILDRVGTTTIYLASAPGDFSNPDSFRSGTAVQVSSLRQQVVVDTSTGAFSVVNINVIEHTYVFIAGDSFVRLGRIDGVFRTVLNGHLNSPGLSPSGWFGGYAVGASK